MIKSVPARLLAGMLFFYALAAQANLELATQFFEDEAWNLCRRECRRALLNKEQPQERYELLETICRMRTGDAPETVLPVFTRLKNSAADRELSAIAAYEAGRLHWMLNQPDPALKAFAHAFHSTADKELFLHSSCSLFLLLNEFSELKATHQDLMEQITTSRSQYRGALFSRCAKPTPHNASPPRPHWIIRFYRSQISPAIGDRCVLHPSCSEYCNQAHAQHGLLALPLIADRLFREPDVSNERANPIVMKNGQIRYQDPVHNHTFWMKK